jgi:type IV secretion system protein VirB4
MLIRKAQSSKKVHLNVDAVTYWVATNNPPDNLKKWQYFERFGIADGLTRLAKEFPPRAHAAACGVNLTPLGEIA